MAMKGIYQWRIFVNMVMRGYGPVAVSCKRGSEGLGSVAVFTTHGNEGKGPVAVYSKHDNGDSTAIKRVMFFGPPSVLNKHCLTWLLL
jgi:hypothetical protein